MITGPTLGRSCDLLVIGGGIHGSAAAVEAARQGLSVTLIEKDTMSRHASGSNAGGVRRLNRHPAELALSALSMQIWHQIKDVVGDDCGFQSAPQIRVAESVADLHALNERAALVRSLGFDNEVVLSESDMRAILPAVSSHCVGALASLDDGFAQPHRTTVAFARAAERAGVRIFEGVELTGLRQLADGWEAHTGRGMFRAGCILNAAGAWGGRVAAMIGDVAPIEAVAPMMLVTSSLPPFCNAVVGAAGRPLSCKQMPNGTVVIGGGRLGRADPGRNSTDLCMAELAQSVRTAIEIFPILRNAQIVRAWSGIEGRMSDHIPVIGPSRAAPRAFHSFGYSTHGFQLGPGVGRVMGQLIATGQCAVSLDAFYIGRFAAV